MNFPISIEPLEERKVNLNKAILSISGWRKIFAADQEENSMTEELTMLDQKMIACAAIVTGDFFREEHKSSLVALARDSRPTGNLLAQIYLRGLCAAELEVRFLDLCAVTQLLAYVQRHKTLSGFVYISASHNPSGYNGIKFGLGDGGVLADEPAKQLIEKFKSVYLNDLAYLEAIERFNKCSSAPIEKALSMKNDVLLASESAYYEHTLNVLSGTENESEKRLVVNSLKNGIANNPMQICCDFNGSARTLSIDEKIIKDFQIGFESINATPGVFAHRIVPEGHSLYPLRDQMLVAQAASLLGFVPDCDGDRGNLLFTVVNNGKRDVILPDAQFTFALVVLSELSFLKVFYPKMLHDFVIVANDPTSLVVDFICNSFGVEFQQAEVGEANILALATSLKAKGKNIRVIGEGSNGGNITFPSRVRDPLSTVFSIVKLLTLSHPLTHQKLSETALQALGIEINETNITPKNLLQALYEKLSRFQSTSSFEESALLRFQCAVDFGNLKENYESKLVNWFLKNEEELNQKFKFFSYKIFNYEGEILRQGPGNRTGDHSGGHKVQFFDENGKKRAFFWMRPSRTEPVFRVMVCIEGTLQEHDHLLQVHRNLVAESIY